MLTIATKYIKATDTRCSGIRVSTYGKNMFIAWQHDLSGTENHQWAALQLCLELGYSGRFYRSENPSSKTGFLYACIDESKPAFTLGKALTAAEHLAA
jgi:hypothetical protein